MQARTWTVVGVFLCSAVVAEAQQPSEADLQRMQTQAQEMQACFAKMDQGAMADFRTRGEQMAAEMKALCAAGNRDEAQTRAQDYAQSMAASPVMKSLADCGEMAKQMLATLPFTPGDESHTETHVCDSGL